MTDKLREVPPLAEIPVGREVREVRLLAKLLDGFANPIRLSALLLLSRNGEMSVGKLVEAIGAPQPRVSDHLRCLAWCGYVRARREGSNMLYSIADERVLGVLELSEGILADIPAVRPGDHLAWRSLSADQLGVHSLRRSGRA